MLWRKTVSGRKYADAESGSEHGSYAFCVSDIAATKAAAVQIQHDAVSGIILRCNAHAIKVFQMVDREIQRLFAGHCHDLAELLLTAARGCQFGFREKRSEQIELFS